MVKDRSKLIEAQYGKSMYDILFDLATSGHNKASAARHLGYERTYFTGTLCKRVDPEKTLPWTNGSVAARNAQIRRWRKQPLSNAPIYDIKEMAEMRDRDPPIPYYVMAEIFGYEAVSIMRWLRLYDKYGDKAFTVPREELGL